MGHSDGTVTWKEGQSDLEDRNSLAKAFRSKDCRGKGVTIHDMRSYKSKAPHSRMLGSSHSTGKRYAQGAYDMVIGDVRAPDFSGHGWAKWGSKYVGRFRAVDPP